MRKITLIFLLILVSLTLYSNEAKADRAVEESVTTWPVRQLWPITTKARRYDTLWISRTL